MEVRRARVGDAAALAEVARRAITITGASVYDTDQLAHWSGSFTPARLEALIGSTSVHVVEVAPDVAAGFASLLVRADGGAEVDLLYVDPSYAGQGVARRAVEAVESDARARGVTTLRADASLLAAPVFEHLGYAVVEHYDKPRGTVTFRNTWLTKHLV
jgi:putative acetyltransferase